MEFDLHNEFFHFQSELPIKHSENECNGPYVVMLPAGKGPDSLFGNLQFGNTGGFLPKTAGVSYCHDLDIFLCFVPHEMKPLLQPFQGKAMGDQL